MDNSNNSDNSGTSANASYMEESNNDKICMQHMLHFNQLVASAMVELEEEQGVHGGSPLSRSQNKYCNHAGGHQCLFLDYFSETPVYAEVTFCCWFRMRRSLF